MNIYIRRQEIDLFKYLSDEDTASLMKEAENCTIPAREHVFSYNTKPEYLVVLLEGELEIIGPTGKSIGCIFPGEISGEACFLSGSTAIYALRAVQDSRILKISFAALERFIAASPENGAIIHAAINDTLCLKIIRVTHTRVDHA
jgi:CRP-like cAMP-binding protein